MFVRLLRAEIVKTSGLPILKLLALFLTGMIGLMFWHYCTLSLVDYNRAASYDPAPNPWYFYYFGFNMLVYTLVFPIALSVIPFVVKNVEDKADAWKRTLTLPGSLFSIQLSKLAVIWFYASMFVAITLVGYILSGIVLSMLRPEFGFSESPTYHKFLIILFFKFEWAALAIVTIGYTYMLFIRKTLVSLLLSIFVPIVGFIIPPYNVAVAQDMVFKRIRYQTFKEGGGYEDLHFGLFGSSEAICLGIIIVALFVILYKSTRPIVDYE